MLMWEVKSVLSVKYVSLYGILMALHKRKTIPKGQQKMDNPEKLATFEYTRRRQPNQKDNTICVGHH